MANNINYQKELDSLLASIQATGNIPKLLLHSCCAPCSSYVLSYLSQYFDITVLYYNPNISPQEEYEFRKAEQIRFIKECSFLHPVSFLDCDWEEEQFLEIAKGLEDIPEGGARCFKCYELRLRKTAELAKIQGFDYFCTTLSISPLKNAQRLNEIGQRLAEEFKVDYLPSDFKKNEGYKQSILLSKEHNLYRQDYCGCVYSKRNGESQI